MDPDDYALKEIRKRTPEFVVCRHRFCQNARSIQCICLSRSKNDNMKYDHYTWKSCHMALSSSA